MGEIKFVIARQNKNTEVFKTCLEDSLRQLQVPVFQATTEPGKPDDGTAAKYNAILQAIYDKKLVTDDDILVFCEEDVKIIDSLFKEKVKMLFEQKPDIGLFGVLGSSEITETCEWWMNKNESAFRGHLLQDIGKKTGESTHLIKGSVGYFDDVVAIDKSIMIMKAGIAKEIPFNSDMFKQDYLYNIDLGFSVLDKGYSIAVADILIYKHNTPPDYMSDPIWIAENTAFKEQLKTRYDTFPITINSFETSKHEIMEIEL